MHVSRRDLPFKAYIYVTCGTDLLVMHEPEVPEDEGWQVPGGTVDPGESFLLAALREFEEETGLSLSAPLAFLGEETYLKTEIRNPGWQHRVFYHAALREKPATHWDHFEMHPSDGGPPIRLRYEWIDLTQPAVLAPALFYADFDRPLTSLRQRLGLKD